MLNPDLIALFVIAIINAGTAVLTWRTHLIAIKTKEAAVSTATNMAIVEKATNSMKDALVKATGEASFAAGKDEARAEGEIKAAALAEGKLHTE